MYKLIKIPMKGGGTMPDQNYRLEEDGVIINERVVIRKPTQDSTIYGGLFQRDSRISIPTGHIEIYNAPHGGITTSTGIYPIMSIPTIFTVIM